ncbi:DUF4232 domain-containing protein [Paractinoplanes lichenicola]|uniref:DUF4232 domain-containing protein n=1 Tax=Paractinoplanes lichenicola TaxID=2802976 RepID=A0ABS1VXY1_9ACTN|nr:DUF4232 domain-containing protein [Actinoplanes lichenicola]MBL7259299.1 DUF4232 domain-containing protein [Actinoplanes lichenicola]
MRARLCLLTAGLAFLLAGCTDDRPWATAPPASPTSSASPSAVAPSFPCATLRTEAVDAAMGLRALGISLINCGRTPYEVDGYPEVRALDEKQAPLAVEALEGVGDIAPGIPYRDAAPSPFTLAPGARATAIIVWRNKYDDPSKPPLTVPLLRMAVRSGYPAQVLTPEGGLDLGTTARFGVSPWLPVSGAAATDQTSLTVPRP